MLTQTFAEQVAAFAAAVEAAEIAGLKRWGTACEANVANARTKVVPGKKYTKVDVGSSGRFMVENSTGLVYGIKAYGVIHRGHYNGTLEEATRRAEGNAAQGLAMRYR